MGERLAPSVENTARTFSEELIEIRVGDFRFVAKLELGAAPRTCKFFKELLPFAGSALHCRWSGESMWVPFTPPEWTLEFENHTSYPRPGQILIYAQGFSEPEILMPYGACAFNSRVGQIAGNHVLTIEAGISSLADLGHDVLWKGAHEISFRLLPSS